MQLFNRFYNCFSSFFHTTYIKGVARIFFSVLYSLYFQIYQAFYKSYFSGRAKRDWINFSEDMLKKFFVYDFIFQRSPDAIHFNILLICVFINKQVVNKIYNTTFLLLINGSSLCFWGRSRCRVVNCLTTIWLKQFMTNLKKNIFLLFCC